MPAGARTWRRNAGPFHFQIRLKGKQDRRQNGHGKSPRKSKIKRKITIRKRIKSTIKINEHAGNNLPEFSHSRTTLWQRLLTLPPRRPKDRSPARTPAGNLRSSRRRSGKTGWGHPLCGTNVSLYRIHFHQYWTGVRLRLVEVFQIRQRSMPPWDFRFFVISSCLTTTNTREVGPVLTVLNHFHLLPSGPLAQSTEGARRGHLLCGTK